MDYFETSAPTPAISSIKVILVVAVRQGWKLQQWDVTLVFVNTELDVEESVHEASWRLRGKVLQGCKDGGCSFWSEAGRLTVVGAPL